MDLEKIFKRFNLEPRAKTHGNWYADTWLVIFDKQNNKYLTNPNTKKFTEVKDTDDFIKFIKSYLKDNE